MIVPFIFTMLTFNEAPYLWAFNKFLDFSKQNAWPLIAQEIYFNKYPSVFAREGNRVSIDKTFVEENLGYKLPKDEDLKKIKKYIIPQSLLEKLILEKGSISNAFCYLLTERYEPLEDLLEKYFKDIIETFKEPIEAIITLCHYPSLSRVAEKNNIKIIHFEQGTFRYPTYINTAFLDFDNLYGGTTIATRWKDFQLEATCRITPIFSKREILATFLKTENLNNFERLNIRPTKKMGIALGYAVWELFSCKTHYNDSELLYRVRKKVGSDQMLVRKHPGDPYGAQYGAYAAQMDNPKRSTIEFILSCENITTLGSNVAIEAMLLGRGAHVIVPCPSQFAAAKTIEEEGKCACDEFLSFFVFGYLVPFEFLSDVEYLRWRLTGPSEREVYFRHLDYYFNKKGIPTDLIFQPGKDRLKKMLMAQGYTS